MTANSALVRVALRSNPPVYAQVVELADTLASGASDRKAVEVQVLFWHHFRKPRQATKGIGYEMAFPFTATSSCCHLISQTARGITRNISSFYYPGLGKFLILFFKSAASL